IRLRGHGPIAKLATAKLEFCRYSTLVKDPSQRQTLVTHELPAEAFQDDKFVTLELSARLDSSKPGANFAIGRGLGVVVTLSPRDAAKKAGDVAAWLEIADIEVIFTGRTINENVTV
ncbi:MAG: hypothetical protein VYA62_10205, partial [Planctomycetota bacterium]|nr:hypothetical protein [Planctomycetota bacterium]